MRPGGRKGRLDAMVVAPDRTTLRLYGRILVLLALANELRAHNAPAWRLERNRLEVDRAIADLARQR